MPIFTVQLDFLHITVLGATYTETSVFVTVKVIESELTERWWKRSDLIKECITFLELQSREQTSRCRASGFLVCVSNYYCQTVHIIDNINILIKVWELLLLLPGFTVLTVTEVTEIGEAL